MTDWTFTLKDGLKDEYGTEVKAEEIYYAVSRLLRHRDIQDSKIGGMYNDNVRGMATFQTMYVTQ